ncbi:hypothetical protein MKX78_23725 [Cytobacillus sp. FSL R5-0569]|uniref:hypothetical protein n=1 Tax=Cytobacillus TaxID=2675230 RepID=UPI0027839761|nr:hypothetical protein [Cytobacillus kochii]MDQ0186690.1 hypothetical protein [Cytobacillus kochii]
MKRLTASILSLGLILTACGGSNSPLGLDGEKIQKGVNEKAQEIANIKNGGYKEEDIELVQLCAVVQNGKEEFGHTDLYTVSWQTSDGEHQYKHRMSSDDYVVDGATKRYTVYEDIGCYEY